MSKRWKWFAIVMVLALVGTGLFLRTARLRFFADRLAVVQGVVPERTITFLTADRMEVVSTYMFGESYNEIRHRVNLSLPFRALNERDEPAPKRNEELRCVSCGMALPGEDYVSFEISETESREATLVVTEDHKVTWVDRVAYWFDNLVHRKGKASK